MTLKQLAKDAGTMVVLAVCTTIVFGTLLLMVYLWPYVLASAIVLVCVLALRGRNRDDL